MRSLAALILLGGLALVGCKSSSGGPSVKPGCPADPNDLISDFEISNGIAAVDGRQGGWYTYGDDFGSFANASGYDIDPAGNPNCTSEGALHVKGTGFSDWGAATGVDFKPRPSDGDGGYLPKMTYDASKYKGVAFWMRASAVLEGVQVSFPDLQTDGFAPPHAMMDSFDPTNNCTDCTCVYLTGSWQNCSPYLVQFGKKGDAGAAVAFAKFMDTQIDTTWRRYEILFSDTHQDPGNLGYHTADDKLDAAHITAMAIQVNANYDTTPKSARDFEIWLDDVTFLK